MNSAFVYSGLTAHSSVNTFTTEIRYVLSRLNPETTFQPIYNVTFSSYLFMPSQEVAGLSTLLE